MWCVWNGIQLNQRRVNTPVKTASGPTQKRLPLATDAFVKWRLWAIGGFRWFYVNAAQQWQRRRLNCLDLLNRTIIRLFVQTRFYRNDRWGRTNGAFNLASPLNCLIAAHSASALTTRFLRNVCTISLVLFLFFYTLLNLNPFIGFYKDRQQLHVSV